MEIKETNSVNTGSYRSKNKKLVPVKVLDNSRRGSVDPLSLAGSTKKGVDEALQNLSEFVRRSSISLSEKKNDSKGSTRSIPVDSSNPSQVKKAEFGDCRPLVKDVWSHYPFQEAPLPPKDPREFLNVVLNRKSTFAPKKEDENQADEESSSNEELEMENPCHFEMFPQLPANRPSSANSKIDSQTKLSKVEDEENSEFRRAKREGIDLEKHVQEDGFNYDKEKGKFLRTSEDQKKNIFKINRHPTGVVNEKIWKKVPVSPHVDNYSAKPLELNLPRKSLMAPLNPLLASSHGKMSLNKGVDKLVKPKNRHYDLDTPKFNDKVTTELPELTRSASVKSYKQNNVTFNPSLFSSNKANLNGLNNLIDLGGLKKSNKKGADFGTLSPFIKHLEESANHYFDTIDNERFSLTTKPNEKTINIKDKKLPTEVTFGLKRRSASNKKAIKVVVNSTMSNNSRRMSLTKNDTEEFKA